MDVSDTRVGNKANTTKKPNLKDVFISGALNKAQIRAINRAYTGVDNRADLRD